MTSDTTHVAGADPVPVSKKLLLVNSLSSVGTRILGMTVFAAAIGFLTRVVPDAELELLPLTESIAAIMPLAQILFTAGIARHATAHLARGDERGVTEVVSSIFPPLATGAFALLIFGVICVHFAPSVLQVPASLAWQLRLMVCLIFANAILAMLMAPFTVGLFMKQRFVAQSLIEIVGTVTRIVILLIAMGLLVPHVYWIVVAQVSGQCTILLLTVALSMRLVPSLRFRVRSFRWPVAKEVLQFGAWATVGQVGGTIRQAADAPLLHFFATPTAVNEYYLGMIIDRIIRTLTLVAGNTVLPVLTAIHVSGDMTRLRNAFFVGGRWSTWAALFLALPAFVFRDEFWSIYLDDALLEMPYIPTVAVLLLLSYLFYYPSSMLIRISHAQGNVGPVTRLAVAGQFLNLGFTIVFVGLMALGSLGSAMGTLMASIVTQVGLIWPLAIRMMGTSWRRFITDVVARGWLPFVACVVSGEVLMTLVPERPQAIVGVAALLVCLYAYLVSLCSTAYERAVIRRIVHRASAN